MKGQAKSVRSLCLTELHLKAFVNCSTQPELLLLVDRTYHKKAKTNNDGVVYYPKSDTAYYCVQQTCNIGQKTHQQATQLHGLICSIVDILSQSLTHRPAAGNTHCYKYKSATKFFLL